MTVDRSLERLRSALAGLEPSERDALLGEARARARDRVLSLLVDELTEVMLEQVRDRLTTEGPARPDRRRRSSAHDSGGGDRPRASAGPAQPARQTAATPPAASRGAGDLGWYVYGVTPAGDAPAAVPGVDPSHMTTTVEEGELAAVVSRVALAEFDEEPLRERLTDMHWLERTARTHEEVLEQIGSQRTLIPMRICSIYRDQAGIRQMLRREEPSLKAGLDHVRGRSEWGVKVFADRSAIAQRADAGGVSESADEEGTGTAYLRHRQHERQRLHESDEELAQACDQIHQQLSSHAADARVLPVHRPEASDHPGEMVLNGAYLVADKTHDAFLAELDACRAGFEALELEFALSGPWPAYNFVPGTIGAAW